MNLGEILILIFVTLAFAFGIWGGIRLFKWNKKDRERLARKNAEKKKNLN